MVNFPFNEISGLTMKLHKLQEGATPDSDHYVYRVSIEPAACSFEAHVSTQMFKAILDTYTPGSFKVETSYLNQSVHLSATVDGSIVLVCCILKGEMLASEDDSNNSIQQLYRDWAERNEWPYA